MAINWPLAVFRALLLLYGVAVGGYEGGLLVALAFIGDEIVGRMFRR